MFMRVPELVTAGATSVKHPERVEGYLAHIARACNFIVAWNELQGNPGTGLGIQQALAKVPAPSCPQNSLHETPKSVLGNLPSHRCGYELVKPTRDRSFRNRAFDLIPFHL
jgi:hypothetical protein